MASGRAEPRVSACRVARGLYTLRYVDSPSQPPPMATLTATSGPLEFIPAPGHESGVLRRPGQVVVVVAQADAAFEIAVSASQYGTGVDASFSLDLLDGGEQGANAGVAMPHATAARRNGERIGSASLPLDIRAHVSRRGDVEVGSGDWIAGPDVVLPIEGLAVSTMRHDVCIDVRVRSAGNQGRWSRWHQDGEFAGTRQRAEPLTGIGLLLHGERSEEFVIAAEAMQLGAAGQTQVGREIEFSGFDPIVGFRLELKAAIGNLSVASTGRGMDGRVFRAKR